MSFRVFDTPSIQNYPKINIDRGSVIKPCVADQTAADQFKDQPASNWKRILHDVWNEGLPFILRCISDIKVPANSNPYYIYLIRFIKYIALLMLHIHRVYLYIYSYFYPYSLMSFDQVCDKFSRCPNWTQAVIRAFAWHPNHDRCALAICNDYIYVYENQHRIRVLRHNQQRKITDLAWHPSDKEILVVATQTSIIIWRIIETNPIANQLTLNAENVCVTTSQNFTIIHHIINPPIVSIQFDKTGQRLFACSPNSSKVAILDIDRLTKLNSNSNNNKEKENQSDHIKYLRRFGQGITKLAWAPERSRLATATTSLFFRVFEPFAWSCFKWSTKSLVQDLIWSRPNGRILLIATDNDSNLYALPFLDDPRPKDVGGNKSIMKALDLNFSGSESDEPIGGRVQSFAWDKHGRRLAISFKDNPESVILYRTVESPTLEFHQIGFIQSDNKSTPLLMNFHDNFKNGSLLTICWSDGNCQHLPFSYSSEQLNNSRDLGSPKTPRSLTNFFYVSQPSQGQNKSMSRLNRLNHSVF